MRIAWTLAFSIVSTSRSSISRAGRHDHLAGRRRDDVLRRGAAEDALAERGHDLAGVDDRLHLQAGIGAAIHLGDDAVLRDVDETARQIAGVGRLQRRVGEALAGAVGRVEVLEHRQAFLEVRDDRALDDLARRLGHQAAHAGELLHLRRRAAGAGVAHHVDRVHRLLAAARRPSRPPGCASSSRRRRWSVHFAQASTTLLYFSPWVIRPSLYCCS